MVETTDYWSTKFEWLVYLSRKENVRNHVPVRLQATDPGRNQFFLKLRRSDRTCRSSIRDTLCRHVLDEERRSADRLVAWMVWSIPPSLPLLPFSIRYQALSLLQSRTPLKTIFSDLLECA